MPVTIILRWMWTWGNQFACQWQFSYTHNYITDDWAPNNHYP